MIRRLAAILATILVALTLWAAPPAAAQEVDPEWAAVVGRAEQLLDPGTSEAALLALRDELVAWRARFQTEQSPGMARIDTLRAQIDALGPVPEEGVEEPSEIAAQRAELQGRLEALLAPVRAAEAAFTEANGLVAETDRLIEARRARELLRKGPAPVNPATWPAAIRAYGGWLAELGEGLRAPFATPEARLGWQRQGVELGLLVFVAIILLWRSGTWLARLRDRIAPAEAASPAIRIALFGISFAQLALPVAGLAAVARIVQVMGVQGEPARLVAMLLPTMGSVVLLSRWLAVQALPRRETAHATLPVGQTGRREARLHFGALGALLAAWLALRTIAAQSPEVAANDGLAAFALQVVAGINMVRLGQLLVHGGRAEEGDETEGLWPQVLRNAGRALMGVGVAAPVAAALGYVELASAVLWPTVMTLALIAAVGVLQAFLFDLHAALTGRTDGSRDALAPTLVGFALAVAALPLLALIWGVRASTLAEWWERFLRGFTLGETRISPANILTLAIVFLVGYLIVRIVKAVLRTNVLPKTRLDSGGSNAILSGTGYVGILIAALIAVTAAGIDLSGLAIVAGALSVGIGFGLQTIVQNFVSGIILLIERPIKIGDWVQAGGVEGFVREISVRSTRIETFDRQDVIVPNADLIAGVVTNYTLANSAGRVVITLGVAYGTDTRRVQAILEEVAAQHPMVILNPPPLVTFDGFGADALMFTTRVVLRDILFKVVVTSELNHAIAERFEAEGLEVPFAQRDIWLRNPEALRGVAAGEGA